MTIIQKAIIYILAALLAISTVYGVYAHFNMESLRSDNKTLTTNINTYKQQLSDANGQIADQNTKIANAQKNAKDMQDKLDNLAKVLTDNDEKYKEIIDKLKKQPTPKDCKSTIIYLKKSLEAFK